MANTTHQILIKNRILPTIILLFSVFYIFFFINISNADAWLSGYSNRKTITVDATNIDANLSNFPVYIPITADTDIGGNMQDTTNYYDIRFTDTSDTILPYEEDTMVISGGSATGGYWVQDDLNSTTGSTIYVYYGKSGDTDGSSATGVWDNNYMGVWHLGEGDSTAADFYQDSTSNNNDGQLTDTDGDTNQVDGQVGKAMDFSGDTDRINVGNNSSLDLGSTFTLSGWVNVDIHTAGYSFIIAKDGALGGSYDLGFKDSKPYVAINDGTWGEYTSDSALSTGAWHHIAGARNSSNQLTIYVDGSAVKTFSSVKTPQTVTTDTTIGLRSSAGYEFDGKIDETRISNTTRDANWIKFAHANGGGESDFEISLGAEQENIAPTVSSFSPLDDSSDIAIDSNLIITFSESVSTSTGNIIIKKGGDNSTVETFDVSSSALVTGSGTTYTINPSSDLSNNTDYYVQIDSTAFQDASSNSYAGISDTTTWNFTTVAALVVENTVAANGPIFTGSASSLPGYIKPRMQTIYPDGRIAYLDEVNTIKTPIKTEVQNTDDMDPITKTINETLITEPTVSYEKPLPSPMVILKITRDLHNGIYGEDVRELQKYLNSAGYMLTESGAGSVGNETTFFGTLTQDALARFQKDHGINPSQGYFGPITRAFLNLLK